MSERLKIVRGQKIDSEGTPMFVRNAWYIAAWSDEVAQVPLGRRILDEPVVLFRDSSGAIAALQDRCCHRGAPLSLGEVVPRGIQCGYHGLVFDSAGQCVLVPGGHKVPPGAQVRTYPVVERDAFVWIWMGKPEQADRSLLIDFPYHNDSRNWPHQHTMMHLRSGYLLVLDNLMDLSHLGYVHKGTVGGDATTHVEARMRTMRTPNGVRFERWMLDSVPPPTYVKAVGFKATWIDGRRLNSSPPTRCSNGTARLMRGQVRCAIGNTIALAKTVSHSGYSTASRLKPRTAAIISGHPQMATARMIPARLASYLTKSP
jgi:phenylpropionate dioxygenase-like ring-hydroxylating dioxygenase large terminal subunit